MGQPHLNLRSVNTAQPSPAKNLSSPQSMGLVRGVSQLCTAKTQHSVLDIKPHGSSKPQVIIKSTFLEIPFIYISLHFYASSFFFL
jgi:hypothetical protein